MGTSSIFDGPVNSLLPDDYNDSVPDNSEDDGTPEPKEIEPSNGDSADPDQPDDQDKGLEQPIVPAFRWKDAKTAMTNYVKGLSSDRGRVMNHYVGASGGSKQLTRSSAAGRSTAVSLGRILQDFRNNGVETTLQSLQIDYVGKGIKSLLSELVNVISGKSNSKEDMAARGAANEAVAEMYEVITENDGDIESLRRIDELTFRKILEVFMSEYIFKRVMSDLQSRFEKYENNPKVAVQKEQELKDYVKVKVELRVREIRPETLDYSSKSISNEVNNLFTKCFQAFEGYL
ncbi:Qat anti-phage system associated protein QatB [Niallia oryzisoli]|uniref:Qat anti-phage system associated protein QatB n=1 Tax=Niallia oryzisoli TaxID=1737571 RepID=UPI0037370088